MASAADVRRIALALPEATEEPHFELTSYRVRAKIFASVPPAGTEARVFVDELAARAIAASEPCCQELYWGSRLSGVRVELALASEELIEELLAAAYLRRATRRVAAQLRPAAPPDAS